MRKFLPIVAVLAALSASAYAADTGDGLGSLVRYDRQWLYSQYVRNCYFSRNYGLVYLGFIGPEVVNGKTYHKLCPLKESIQSVAYDPSGKPEKFFNVNCVWQIPEEKYSEYGAYPYLLRQEGDRVYMLLPDNGEGLYYMDFETGYNPSLDVKAGTEVLLYDFSSKQGDQMTVVCGTQDFPEYITDIDIVSSGEETVDGEPARYYELDSERLPYQGDSCLVVEGIGSTYFGMLHFTTFDFAMNDYPAYFVAAFDDSGNVIYGKPFAAPKQQALDLVRLDGEWEYVYEDGTFATMRFDGEEIVDGAVYHRFVTTATATPDSENPGQFTYDFAPAAAPALLRQAGNRLLRLVGADGGNTLYCLYDFDTQLNGTCSVLMDNEGDMSRRYMEYTGLDMYKVGDEWCALHKLRDTQPDPAGGTVFEGSVLQTVGPLAGGTLAGFGTDAAHGSCRLNRLYDLAGNVIYTAAGVDSPLASVKGVSADNGNLSISIGRGGVNVTSADMAKTTLDIYTIDGRRMMTQSGAGNITVSIATLQPGLYIARATAGGRHASAKFTVR